MNNTRLQTIDGSSRVDSQMTAALEHPPAIAIPADFASRVAAKAAAMPQRKRTARPMYARAVSILLVALLLGVLFLVAPHAQPSFASVAFDTEMSGVLLLGVLVYWLAYVPKQSL
jgi:hypothetical protein